MRVVGLLNFYDEYASWLAAATSSAARFCDHLIAVDGAYALYPGAHDRPRSPADQHEIIMRTAEAAGMGVTIHAPNEPWYGNEVEKRDLMFRIGEHLTTPYEDWYFVIDADEVVTKSPPDIRDRLAATEADVGQVLLSEREANEKIAQHLRVSLDYTCPLRRIFRVLENMHIQDAHYVVTGVKHGRKVYLAGAVGVHDLEPPEDLTDLRLENRNRQRDHVRNQERQTFYERREELGIEKIKERT